LSSNLEEGIGFDIFESRIEMWYVWYVFKVVCGDEGKKGLFGVIEKGEVDVIKF